MKKVEYVVRVRTLPREDTEGCPDLRDIKLALVKLFAARGIAVEFGQCDLSEGFAFGDRKGKESGQHDYAEPAGSGSLGDY